jgi:transcriptional regulatory protein LevR
MREEFDAMKEDLQIADSLYKKRDEYLTLGELNDIEQKFGKDGNIEIYIVSNDLSTETKDWKEIIEKNLRNNIKYFYLTNEKNKEHFNGIFKDLKEKRGLKDKNLQDNFSISLNNCLFKFLPKFSEIVIYRDNNKAPIKMQCFVSYTNKGEKELYKKMDIDFSDTIWTLIDECIKNNQSNNCNDCTQNIRCKKHIPND